MSTFEPMFETFEPKNAAYWKRQAKRKDTEITQLRQRIAELEFEAWYVNKPVDPGDNSYPNAVTVAECLRNAGPDLHTEARFVLWQARRIAELEKESTECLCNTCNTIYPLQRPGEFVQPCPKCGDTMEFTSYNLRRIKKLEAGQGEPVAYVRSSVLGEVGWNDGPLPVGTKLYTSAPRIPEGYILVKQDTNK